MALQRAAHTDIFHTVTSGKYEASEAFDARSILWGRVCHFTRKLRRKTKRNCLRWCLPKYQVDIPSLYCSPSNHSLTVWRRTTKLPNCYASQNNVPHNACSYRSLLLVKKLFDCQTGSKPCCVALISRHAWTELHLIHSEANRDHLIPTWSSLVLWFNPNQTGQVWIGYEEWN